LRLRTFNFTWPFSFTDASLRRGLAISSAIVAHGVLVVLVLVLPIKARAPHQLAIAINLSFAHAPQDEPAEVLPEPIPVPEPVVITPPPEPIQTPTPNDQPPTDIVVDPAPTSARTTDLPASSDAPISEDTYMLRPGTRSVLQGIQCPGDPDAFARTGLCPQDARRHAQVVATEETASDFYSIDLNAIRALYGRAPHALSGQATLGDGTQRRSLSNADSIREALPASQPDPAFGD
jgi:hypothetical protein